MTGRWWHGVATVAAVALATAAMGQPVAVAVPPPIVPPAAVRGVTGDVTPVHDPVLLREGATWHLFSTGIGKDGQGPVSKRMSADPVHRRTGTPPFAALPGRAMAAVPGATNLWAPGIAFVNGRHRLYYSGSTFGSNRPAIGLATGTTLDPAAPGHGWRDEGLRIATLHWATMAGR